MEKFMLADTLMCVRKGNFHFDALFTRRSASFNCKQSSLKAQKLLWEQKAVKGSSETFNPNRRLNRSLSDSRSNSYLNRKKIEHLH